MFCATFRDTKNMRYLMDSLSELAEDAFVVFEEGGLRIEAADPSLICKIEAFFSRKGFSEYLFDEKDFVTMDVESFSRIARRIRPQDVMRISLGEGVMKVSLDGLVCRDFQNALIEPRQESLPKIELDFPVTLEMDSSVFREIIKDVSIVGNTVVFGVDDSGFFLIAEGDTGKARIDIPKGNSIIRRLERSKDFSSKFNLGYLLSFLRSSFISETVVLNFGDKELPLKLSFPFEEDSSLAFYLAPMEF